MSRLSLFVVAMLMLAASAYPVGHQIKSGEKKVSVQTDKLAVERSNDELAIDLTSFDPFIFYSQFILMEDQFYVAGQYVLPVVGQEYGYGPAPANLKLKVTFRGEQSGNAFYGFQVVSSNTSVEFTYLSTHLSNCASVANHKCIAEL